MLRLLLLVGLCLSLSAAARASSLERADPTPIVDIAAPSNTTATSAPINNSTASNNNAIVGSASNATTVSPAGNSAATTTTPAMTPVTASNKATVNELLRASTLAEMGNAPRYMGNIHIANVAEVWGTVIAGSALFHNFTTEDNLVVRGVLSAAQVTARAFNTHQLNTQEIRSPTGTVIVNADLIVVNNAARPSVRSTSFIAEDLVVGGVKQWKLVRHESFSRAPAQGWSLLETSSCNGKDFFLGGHCRIAAGEAAKRFDRLPPHTQARVTARYHFIDNWQGETAFLKLDDHYVWTDHTPHAPSQSAQQRGINMCGSSLYPELKMSAPIDVTIPHSDSFLEVAFGSTGDPMQDPCQRSFGVDDVMLYVR